MPMSCGHAHTKFPKNSPFTDVTQTSDDNSELSLHIQCVCVVLVQELSIQVQSSSISCLRRFLPLNTGPHFTPASIILLKLSKDFLGWLIRVHLEKYDHLVHIVRLLYYAVNIFRSGIPAANSSGSQAKHQCKLPLKIAKRNPDIKTIKVFFYFTLQRC